MNVNKLSGYLFLFILFFIPFILSALFPDFFSVANAQINDGFFKLRFLINGKEQISPYLRIYNLDDDEYFKITNSWKDILIRLKEYSAKTTILNFMPQAIPVESFTKNQQDIETQFVLPGRILNIRNNNFINESYNVHFLPHPHISGFPPTVIKDHLSFVYNRQFGNECWSGISNLFPDKDGIIRRLPLFFLSEDGYYFPSLVFSAICLYFNVNPSDAILNYGSQIILPNADYRMGKKDIAIPIDDKGQMIINYPGPFNSSFDNLSVKKMIHEKPILLPSSLFTGSRSLVLLGDISSWKGRFSSTMYDPVYPENLIIASALNTILSGNYLRLASFLEKLLFYFPCFIMLGLFLFLSDNLDLKTFALALPGTYCLILLVNLLLFFCLFLFFGLLIDLLPLLFGLLITFIFLLISKLFKIENKRMAEILEQVIIEDKIEEKENLDHPNYDMESRQIQSEQFQSKENKNEKFMTVPKVFAQQEYLKNQDFQNIDAVLVLRSYIVKTERQVNTALLLLQGKSYIEIMYDLGFKTEAAVGQTARRIYKKCNVHNRQGLINKIYNINPPDPMTE